MDKESNKSLKKTKCRICRGPTNQRGHLYKCLDKNCGSGFWHRKVLQQFKTKLEPKDLKNKTLEKEVLSASNIPIEMKGNKRHVYVIKLSKKRGEKKDSVYVGETSHHPYRRYLQHLRGYKAGKKHVTRRGKALLFTEMGYAPAVAKEREKALAKELESQYIVYGGH